MALIYRSDSAAKRMKNKKRPKPPPKKPKFPKDALRNKDGSLKKVSGPSNPVLGTAHPENRLNGYFGIKSEDLPRTRNPPSLNAWMRKALLSIAYELSKAHHLTKQVGNPPETLYRKYIGFRWKKYTREENVSFKSDHVLTHHLRNIATELMRMRRHFMDENAPQDLQCLDESDLLWQNILEPFTGILQIISDAMFRGYDDLEIHKIDGLKLARSIRIIGEEVKLTAIPLDSMMGQSATIWTGRAVKMATDTARKWRNATIKHWGLERIYGDKPDTEFDDVEDGLKQLAALIKDEKRLAKSQGPQKESSSSGVVEEDNAAVQMEENAEASNSGTKGSILKKAPREPPTGGPSVFLPKARVYDQGEAYEKARKQAYEERELREYTERCEERTRQKNLPDEELEELPVMRPTVRTRSHGTARNRLPHRGLEMDDQDMEMDPLRQAQINGVGNGESILSYPNFPSAHLTDNRTRIEVAPRESDRRHRKADNRKSVERRSALKKEKTETPESSLKNEKIIPPQSAFGKDGIKQIKDQVRRVKSNDHIVTQAKDHVWPRRENRVEIKAPANHRETKKSLTFDRANRTKESRTPKKANWDDEEARIRARIAEIKRPRVRFADLTPEDKEARSSHKGGEPSKSRASGESNSNRSVSRKVGESIRSRTSEEASNPRADAIKFGESGSNPRADTIEVGESAASSTAEYDPSLRLAKRCSLTRSSRRRSTNRSAAEFSPSNTGRPFPIPVRVGNEVVPAPPKIRHTRSQSPLVDRCVEFPRDRRLFPAPLKLGKTGSQSPILNHGIGFSEGSSLMPAPLRLVNKTSELSLGVRRSVGVGASEGPIAVPSTSKFGDALTKANLESRDATTTRTFMPMPPPPEKTKRQHKNKHKRSKAVIETRGVGLARGRSSHLSIVSYVDSGSSPSGPPPNRPLPPIPDNKE